LVDVGSCPPSESDCHITLPSHFFFHFLLPRDTCCFQGGHSALQPHAVARPHPGGRGMGSQCAWATDGNRVASLATDGTLALLVPPPPPPPPPNPHPPPGGGGGQPPTPILPGRVPNSIYVVFEMPGLEFSVAFRHDTRTECKWAVDLIICHQSSENPLHSTFPALIPLTSGMMQGLHSDGRSCLYLVTNLTPAPHHLGGRLSDAFRSITLPNMKAGRAHDVQASWSANTTPPPLLAILIIPEGIPAPAPHIHPSLRAPEAADDHLHIHDQGWLLGHGIPLSRPAGRAHERAGVLVRRGRPPPHLLLLPALPPERHCRVRRGRGAHPVRHHLPRARPPPEPGGLPHHPPAHRPRPHQARPQTAALHRSALNIQRYAF